MGEYLTLDKPRYLYRSTYNDANWLRVDRELLLSTEDDQLVCSGNYIQLLQFVVEMYTHYGMNLPPAKELEFLWNVFNSTES